MSKIRASTLSILFTLPACSTDNQPIPLYLYKVISPVLWQQSQHQPYLILTEQDNDFIHLSRDDQLQAIIEKFWITEYKEYIVLKVDSTKLLGELKFEVNRPGGNKYYHLYNGNIPLEAVVAVIEGK